MKERVTNIPCVNATGTHKLDLLMIGKAKSPRCFQNMELPLYYKSSKNAWQTSSLFKDFYNDLFIPQVTRYLESKIFQSRHFYWWIMQLAMVLKTCLLLKRILRLFISLRITHLCYNCWNTFPFGLYLFVLFILSQKERHSTNLR